MRLINLCLLVSFVILGIIVNLANAQIMGWEAENFLSKDGDEIQVLTPPFDTADSAGNNYIISESSGGAFVGVPNGPVANFNFSGAWFKYKFNVRTTGDWYFWGRAIAPAGADNSFLWHFDAADADIKPEEGPVWDFNEAGNFPLGGEKVAGSDPDRDDKSWIWFRLFARDELQNQGASYDNPVPRKLTAGSHTFHLVHREDGAFLDWIFATMDKTFDANKTSPPEPSEDVELQGKLTTTWGQIK